ncbi:hypothetical protein DFH27DRAFT_545718 [Peziza echinospora]|nr:hypothetical protein DFH27DRAFT_545718 [Peziza echinospora]
MRIKCENIKCVLSCSRVLSNVATTISYPNFLLHVYQGTPSLPAAVQSTRMTCTSIHFRSVRPSSPHLPTQIDPSSVLTFFFLPSFLYFHFFLFFFVCSCAGR